VPDVLEWPVQRKSVPDLRGHGVADALCLPSLCDSSTIGIAERDSDPRAMACSVSNYAQQAHILGFRDPTDLA
jgi:hypothetical protein